MSQEIEFERKPMVIAVDFDGVLCEDNYPKIGKEKTKVIENIKEHIKNGDKIILWTCRKGIYLNNAIAWCRKRGIEFDAVNENLPEYIEKYRGDTRKVFADAYYDDRATNMDIFDNQVEETSASRWAEKEVWYAKMENGSLEDSNYLNACYESALTIFRMICNEGHSGFSIGIFKAILNDLIDGRPLTQIKDTEDIWCECPFTLADNGTEYQCKRMPSLFKKVYSDGTVKYSDNDRCYCVNINNPDITYTTKLAADYIDTVYPITMPYSPSSKKFKVYMEDFLVDENNGDFDTVGMFYLINPNGKKFTINRFYKPSINGKGWKEISRLEYLIRKVRRIK